MSNDIELPPMPSVLLNWPHPTKHTAIRDYARACIDHAIAAKDAEIEALRAALRLYMSAGFGNSTDFYKQAEAKRSEQRKSR